MKKDWPPVERIDMRYKVQINMLQCFDVVFLCTKWIHDLEAKIVNEFMATFDPNDSSPKLAKTCVLKHLLQVTVSSIRTKGVASTKHPGWDLFWIRFAFADRTHVGFGLADFPAVFF